MSNTEVAASLRTLADEIERGDFKHIGHTDDKEFVTVGVHKSIPVRVSTGKRRVTLDLSLADYRPVELGLLVELADKGWQQSEGPRKLEVIAERLSPKARLLKEDLPPNPQESATV